MRVVSQALLVLPMRTVLSRSAVGTAMRVLLQVLLVTTTLCMLRSCITCCTTELMLFGVLFRGLTIPLKFRYVPYTALTW